LLSSDDVAVLRAGARDALRAAMGTNDPTQQHLLAGQAVVLAKKSVDRAPGNASSGLTYANALLNIDDYPTAVLTLEELVKNPDAPPVATKLLGYALLFLDQYDRAEQATRRYLAFLPDDLGAQLNLLSALAGRYKKGDHSEKLVENINTLARELLGHPEMVARIRELASDPTEELSILRSEKEFSSLLQP
jgi:tetratricopeptide (TPR) repeat protein